MDDSLFQLLVLALQGFFAIAIFATGRWIAANRENTKEMKSALATIVKENAEAMKEIREALNLVREAAAQAVTKVEFERFRDGQYRDHLHEVRDRIGGCVQGTQFETYRKETRDVLHEFRNNFTDLAIIVGRLETQTFGHATRLYSAPKRTDG